MAAYQRAQDPEKDRTVGPKTPVDSGLVLELAADNRIKTLTYLILLKIMLQYGT